VSQLRHSYPAFRELNAEVLAIAAVGLQPLTAFARELDLPFPVLSDASGEVYFAFGLGKGMVIRSRTLLVAARLVWRAKRLYRPIGDIMQVGGDFIVDGAGLVRFAHSSEDPTDRPEAVELLQLIGNLR
jgi:peroxiredoxin